MLNNQTDITALLLQSGYTQAAAAKKLRCSAPFINQVIHKSRISFRIRSGIAGIIGCKTTDLWPENKKSLTPAVAKNDAEKTVGTYDSSRV